MGKSLAEMIRNGAKIIDVRSAEEFEDEHFPGAVNIPVNELQRRMAELGAKDGSIIMYCASGARSAAAMRAASAAGYKNVMNAGGLSDMPA